MSGEPTYGSIAYVAYDSSGAITGIRAANAADGSGDYSIDAGSTDFEPSWEPGGQRLAFANSGGIAVVNADGTGLTQLTSNACGQILYPCDFAPAWSPFSERIAFCSMRSGTTQIWMMNSDGSNLQQITTGLSLADTLYRENSCNLRWSPDETQIAFTGLTAQGAGGNDQYNVYKMNADGSNVQQLTSCVGNGPFYPSSSCVTPVWSPDGTKIMFADDDTIYGDNLQGSGIYTMNPDGTGISPVFLENNWHNWWPHYSSDGNKIFYTADPSTGPWGAYSVNPDGTNQTQIIGGSKYQTQGSIDCSVCRNFGTL